MKKNELNVDQIIDEAVGDFKDKITKLIKDIIPKPKFKDFKDIKTFEDACESLGFDPGDMIFFNTETNDEIAYKKLKIIVKAINQGWTPDWNDGNQRKWWPWFRLSSGFGFGDSDCSWTYANTAVGSRLCFESEEKSDYCGNQFLELYKEFLT